MCNFERAEVMEESWVQMKKFLNNPKHLVAELLEGFTLAYSDKVRLCGANTVVRAVAKAAGKVRLVTLGGSGHEPGLSGFVGTGMLDVSVAGEIFAAPGARKCLSALRDACSAGSSALLIVLNHAGDILSANIAMEAARSEALPVKMVVTEEDLSSPPGDRRGLAGCVLVYKVAGAAAEQGASLETCCEIAGRMHRNMRTLAVAVRTATHPATGQKIFEMLDSEMEIGMGQHGEAGTGRMPLKTADETAEIMLEKLLDDLTVAKDEQLLVLLNGAGATTHMELFIVFRRLAQLLQTKKIRLVRSLIGEFITTQEQAGFQMTIARMDEHLLQLWDAPADAPYFAKA
jgi:phosphoenolpyruvate---glycerone phosphotransferase subunit DhaK